jgi:hypothetical protein
MVTSTSRLGRSAHGEVGDLNAGARRRRAAGRPAVTDVSRPCRTTLHPGGQPATRLGGDCLDGAATAPHAVTGRPPGQEEDATSLTGAEPEHTAVARGPECVDNGEPGALGWCRTCRGWRRMLEAPALGVRSGRTQASGLPVALRARQRTWWRRPRWGGGPMTASLRIARRGLPSMSCRWLVPVQRGTSLGSLPQRKAAPCGDP